MDAGEKSTLKREAKERLDQLLEERIDEGTMTLDEIEAVVEDIGREMLSWLEERMARRQAPPPENQVACPLCSKPARFRRPLLTRVLTSHGRCAIRRRYHYCEGCRHGFSPIDEVLGLEAGRNATRCVRAWQAKYGSETAFAAVPEMLRELRGLEVSASTVERTTIEIGERVRTEERRWRVPGAKDAEPAEGSAVYLSMDGTMCPLRDRWKRDGSFGKLVCRYGEAKLGVVFRTGRKDGLDTGVDRRGCVGSMRGIADFEPRLLELGRQWGLEQASRLVVLGDGAPWIWNLATAHYPGAVQILDYWHLTEHLWRVANAMHGNGSEAAQEWVKAAQWDLGHDLTTSFLLKLQEWKPWSDEAREVRRVELAYLEANQERMKYGTFLKQGYMIGSGVMESACRHLAAQRLDHAGMHWREGSAEAVLAIRAHRKSSGAPQLTAYA